MPGPGFELETPGLQIQCAVYCATGTGPGSNVIFNEYFQTCFFFEMLNASTFWTDRQTMALPTAEFDVVMTDEFQMTAEKKNDYLRLLVGCSHSYEGCSLISATGFVTRKYALPPESEH